MCAGRNRIRWQGPLAGLHPSAGMRKVRGCHPFGMNGLGRGTGGVARGSLNHRLMAGKPPAWKNASAGLRAVTGLCPSVIPEGLQPLAGG